MSQRYEPQLMKSQRDKPQLMEAFSIPSAQVFIPSRWVESRIFRSSATITIMTQNGKNNKLINEINKDIYFRDETIFSHFSFRWFWCESWNLLGARLTLRAKQFYRELDFHQLLPEEELSDKSCWKFFFYCISHLLYLYFPFIKWLRTSQAH